MQNGGEQTKFIDHKKIMDVLKDGTVLVLEDSIFVLTALTGLRN